MSTILNNTETLPKSLKIAGRSIARLLAPLKLITVHSSNEPLLQALRAKAGDLTGFEHAGDFAGRVPPNAPDRNPDRRRGRAPSLPYSEPARLPTLAVNLTGREKEILSRLSAGGANKEIAAALSITTSTVRTHLRNIFKKLQVQSRTEAVVKYAHLRDAGPGATGPRPPAVPPPANMITISWT